MAVVIDVLRAFSLAAYALDAGASEVIFVPSVDEAIELGQRLGAVVSAEVEGLPVSGVAVSNSPSAIASLQLAGRPLVMRSTSGVRGLTAAAETAEATFAASLVVARATAQRLVELAPLEVTLVASGDDRGHPEDAFCARYIAALLAGQEPPELERDLLAELRGSERWRQVTAGRWPGFPASDLELCLQPDRFAFALPVERGPNGYLRVRR